MTEPTSKRDMTTSKRFEFNRYGGAPIEAGVKPLFATTPASTVPVTEIRIPSSPSEPLSNPGICEPD